MKHYLFILAWMFVLPVLGQNILQIDQELNFNDLKTGKTRTVPLNISETDLFNTSKHNYQYQSLIRLKNVPDTLANKGNLLLAGKGFIRKDSPATNKNTLWFTFDLDASKQSQVANWTTGGLDTLAFLFPIASVPRNPYQTKSLQVDFCPDGSEPVYAYSRKWAYVWPNEAVRMVVQHINPLKYKTTLESSGVTFNTDPGAALSAVSGIFNQNGNFFNKNGFDKQAESKAENATVTKLKELAFIATSIEQQLNSLKRFECLSDRQIGLLQSKQTLYNNLLADTPDEVSLKARLTNLASSVASLTTSAISTTSSVASTTTGAVSTTTVDKATSVTTTIASLTTAKAASFSTSADAAAVDGYNQYLRALADYATDAQLAHRTFEQLDKLDEVIASTTIELRPVKPDQYPNADAIRLTLTTNPTASTTATPVKQIYDVWVVGRFKLDFSAGIIKTGLVDEVYTTRDTTFSQTSTKENNSVTNSVTRQIPVKETSDKFSLALVTLAHYYCRLPSWGGAVNLGVTVGGGVTQKGRPIALGGFSLLLGRQQRWVINAGWAVGTQQVLSTRYAKKADYIYSESAALAYVDRINVKGFIGLSFNWGKNEKIIGPDGSVK